MIFHVARDGQPLGTFTQEEIRDHLEAGRLVVTDLVWMRGMEDWEAMAQVFEIEIDTDDTPGMPPSLPPVIPGRTEQVLPEAWVSSPQIAAPEAPFTGVPENSGFAIASLVLGIVSLGGFCFTGLPAVICGHSALRDIRRSKGRLIGQGFARTGLVLGYLMCAATVVLATAYLAQKAVSKVESRAQESDAVQDARIIMMALKVYAADNDGRYPADLQTLMDQGLLTSEKPLQTTTPGWVGKPGWKYFGGGLRVDDHFSKIVLESRSRDLNGRGIQVTNDGQVDMVLIEDGPVK
jgi:hypothetical protein